MKLFSANIKSLETLYVSNLKKAYDMELRIADAFPDLIEHIADRELKDALASHLEQTKGHVVAVGSLLRTNVGEVETETCKVIGGLTTEARDTIKDVKDDAVCNIALIGAAQQVEHHEIAVYGTLRRWAGLLGLEADAIVLEAIESEEVAADEALSEISARVNLTAVA